MVTPVSNYVLPPNEEKPFFVNRMFARIAPTYDLMNRLMTGGQDQRWRHMALSYCDLPARGRLLDVGTGTGDIAYESLDRFPGLQVVGADFTYEMMAVGTSKGVERRPYFVQGDTLSLSFPDHTFDAVVSGFLIRNVVNRQAAFAEQLRVTKPGGRIVCLETTPPANTMLAPLFRLYFFRVVPFIGALISGDKTAYSYLPHSTVDFPAPHQLQHTMEQAGLRNVFYRTLLFGTVAIHVGSK